MNEEDDGRPESSEEFLISREALEEADSALAGAIEVLGDIANLSHARRLLRTAQGDLGDKFDGY